MKMNDYIFTLPFPPSLNSMYRRSGNHIHISARGRAYKAECCKLMSSYGLDGERLLNRLKIRLKIHAPNKRKFDLDNRFKAVLDALQASGFIEDDEQIDKLSIERGAIDEQKQGYVVVMVDKIGEPVA